jgi:carotenoid 1,2-hydratase
VWWYVDMLDAQGNGMVLIWSFGLPFLPGYTSAARAGLAPSAVRRPSLNVVVYEKSRVVYYLLQEFDADQASHCPARGEWTFGRTRIVQRTESERRTVEAFIDADSPVGEPPLIGHLRIQGVVRESATWTGSVDLGHDWSPVLSNAHAMGELRCGHRVWSVDAPAYHDRNASPIHVDALGISEWAWGRYRIGDFTHIYYLVTPRDEKQAPVAMYVVLHPDGRTTVQHAQVTRSRHALDFFGMRWPKELVLTVDDQAILKIHHRTLVDRGFFYLRSATEAELPDGQRLPGWSEFLRPDRVDLSVYRWLVNMAVHRVGGRNSMWLPLFAGPHDGRVPRLFRQWGRAVATLTGPTETPKLPPADHRVHE